MLIDDLTFTRSIVFLLVLAGCQSGRSEPDLRNGTSLAVPSPIAPEPPPPDEPTIIPAVPAVGVDAATTLEELIDDGNCARAGFLAGAKDFHNGVDVHGWFHAPDDQTQAPPYVVRLLEDLDLAERVLSRGTVETAQSLEIDHIIFRSTLQLHPEDAAELGVDELLVAIKPHTRGLYGTEYRRELAFYILGRRFGVQALIPIVERDICWNPIVDEIWPQLVEEQQNKLFINDDDSENPTIHGSVQLWVVGYQHIAGFGDTDSDLLWWFTEQLSVNSAVDVAGDPIWQSLSDMFLLDFIVYNMDRIHEGGSIRLPDGGQRLILMDNGDTMMMEDPERSGERSRRFFRHVGLFTPNAYRELLAITREDLDTMWVDQTGEPLAAERHFNHVWRRIGEARQMIDELAASHDGIENILFDTDSRPMAWGCFDLD